MILLLGKNGMLAKQVARDLILQNIDFIATSSSELDVTDFKQVDDFIQKTKPSIVINCSAYTQVDNAEDEEEKAFDINYHGVLNIAKSCKKNNSILVHISTDYVFDGSKTEPYLEDDKPNPQTVYGKSKLKGEQAIQATLENYYILRTSWLYGFEGKNFVKTMCNLMSQKSSIQVVNDQRGTPTCCTTLSKIICTIINKLHNQQKIASGVYHISDGETNENGITWYDFAKKIYELLTKYKKITKNCQINPCTSKNFPQKATRPSYTVMSKEKIQSTLFLELKTWDIVLEKFIVKM